MRKRRKRPVYPLLYVLLFFFILRPTKPLILAGSWFPERSANSAMSRENSTVARSPLQYSARFALRQSRVDLMTFQTIDQNVRMSQWELQPLKLTLAKFIYPGQHLKHLFSSLYSLL